MRILLVGALLGIVAAGCTIVNRAPQTQPPKTQLQIREFQTREYDTNDVKLIMKAVLNVLQDDGFVVKNAVVDLGLLTATKEVDIAQGRTSTASDDYWGEVFSSVFRGSSYKTRTNRTQDVRYNKFKVVEVSVNISELGRRSKVRANFQAKILDNTGQPVEVSVIEDPKFYQDFFVKVDKGIFIQKQGF